MKIWEALLLIKSAFRAAEEFPASISIFLKDELRVKFGKEPEADVYLTFDKELSEHTNPFLDDFPALMIDDRIGLVGAERDCLEFYFPYTVLPFLGARSNRCFTIAHFAQTLDGRIASCTGDSKWIGNEENLVHAHRMRALCDGILVGSKTVTTDNPRLNVRKVTGEDPVKVVIGDEALLHNEPYHAIGPDTLIYKKSTFSNGHNGVSIQETRNLDLSELLNGLQARNIHSVYIEGGSFTTSAFIKQQLLDQMQLHFAPKVLGAGVSSLSFEGISQVENAITFCTNKFVPMGDEMMFVGNLMHE